MANALALGASAARLVGSSPTPSTKHIMKGNRERYYAAIGLIIILAVSLALHLWHIDYPPAPAFDEAHFATYAGDYLDRQAFYDIHPPLGKLIYASVLFLASGGARFNDYQFVAYSPNDNGGPLYVETNLPYGSFPYVPLRVTSSIFGLLLIAAFYAFLRSIGMTTTGALLGAFLVAFENALLLQTKLIFIDGMYLTFGLLALALYFKRPRWTMAAGVLFALALGVKLIAVIFAGPVIVDYFLRKRRKTKRLEGRGHVFHGRYGGFRGDRISQSCFLFAGGYSCSPGQIQRAASCSVIATSGIRHGVVRFYRRVMGWIHLERGRTIP